LFRCAEPWFGKTGYLYHYAFAMLIGVAALITWFMFGARAG
jgi:NADH-quinone oxidoreductase subunit L